MRVSGCQYLPDAGGPGGHSPAMVTGPGLRLTSGPGPPGASPGITDEIEVFRLGAGVVGRPGSTRGDSLPTLKREKKCVTIRASDSYCKEENMELETGQGQEADAAVVRLICRLSAQLSICQSNYLDVVKSQTLFFWPNLGKPLFIIFHHSLRLLCSSVHNIKIMGRENHTESETLKSST